MQIKSIEVGCDFSFGRTVVRIILYIVFAHLSALRLYQKYFILFSSIQNGLVITFARNYPTTSTKTAAAVPFKAASTNDILWKLMARKKSRQQSQFLLIMHRHGQFYMENGTC